MNIRVDLDTPIKDGTEVVFRSPVDCSQVTGLIVYYNGGSQEFMLADAHGNNVGVIDHLFAENVAVKVILDVTTSMAFVQNADTNAYLEQRFDDIDVELTGIRVGTGIKTINMLDFEDPEFWVNMNQNGTTGASEFNKLMSNEIGVSAGDVIRTKIFDNNGEDISITIYQYDDAGGLIGSLASISTSLNTSTIAEGVVGIRCRVIKDGGSSAVSPEWIAGSGIKIELTINAEFTEYEPYYRTIKQVDEDLKKVADKVEEDSSLLSANSMFPVMRNGSVGNVWNANAVAMQYVAPTYGAKQIHVEVNFDAPEGYYWYWAYSLYDVETGLTGNVSGAVTEIKAYDLIDDSKGRSYDIDIPDGTRGYAVALWAANRDDPNNKRYVPQRADTFPKGAISLNRVYAKEQEESEDKGNRNKHKEPLLISACRLNKTGNGAQDFQVLLSSDGHGDTKAESNIIEMANCFDTVRAVFNCGDIVADFWKLSETPVSGFMAEVSKSGKPYYVVIGNHEAGTYNSVETTPDSATMYNALILPLVNKGWIKAGEYQQGKCYYYHDFADHNIRAIFLNEYDSPLDLDESVWEAVDYNASNANVAYSTTYNAGDVRNVAGYTKYSFRCKATVTTPANLYGDLSTVPRYKITPGYRCISQAQAQWFLDTLCSTPSGYSVIVVLHNPFSNNAELVDESKFSQKNATFSAMSYMDNDFFAEAVNAFVTGANFTTRIKMRSPAEYLNNAEGYFYEVSKNFATKNQGVQFLCYLGGHTHKDLVLRHKTYTQQIQILPTCTNTTDWNKSKNCDIRRTVNDGYAKDSTTAVSFNATDRNVALVKLGVDVTEDMTKRDFERFNID